MSTATGTSRWTGVGIWHADTPIVFSVFPGELMDQAIASCDPQFPFEVWCAHVDAATPADAEAALVLTMWRINGNVWPDHTTAAGDRCPWSGTHDGRDDDERCPAGCRDSQSQP